MEMRKRICAEIGILASLLGGCTTLDWNQPEPPVEPETTVIWIQNPRAYVAEIAGSSAQQRARVRHQALDEYLRTPSAEQQVRLSLVYDATTQDMADCYSAQDSITHALGGSGDLSAEVEAVLTGLLLRMERRIDDLRAIASRDSELVALRDANRVLEADKAAAEAQKAGVQRALRDAEAKLEALKSIEQTLENNTTQPPDISGEGSRQ
jgi:hypothetical protein